VVGFDRSPEIGVTETAVESDARVAWIFDVVSQAQE
jgi:hypothetical protein